MRRDNGVLASLEQSADNRGLVCEDLPRRQSAASQQSRGNEAFGVTFQEPLESKASEFNTVL